MPLTKRQFMLGVDQEVENWMRRIYSLLAEGPDLAYSEQELRERFEVKRYADQVKFSRALEVLVEIGTVEMRKIVSTAYYSFVREADQNTWELKRRV